MQRIERFNRGSQDSGKLLHFICFYPFHPDHPRFRQWYFLHPSPYIRTYAFAAVFRTNVRASGYSSSGRCSMKNDRTHSIQYPFASEDEHLMSAAPYQTPSPRMILWVMPMLPDLFTVYPIPVSP